MKKDRLDKFSKWWTAYKTSSENDADLREISRKSRREAVNRMAYPDEDSGESLNLIEIILACERAYREAIIRCDKHEISEGKRALHYLLTLCNLIELGASDEVIAMTCLNDDGIAVSMFLKKLEADPKHLAPHLRHLVLTAQGSARGVESAHGSLDKRLQRIAERRQEVTDIRKKGKLSYTRATDLVGESHRLSGKAVRKSLGPTGNVDTDPGGIKA